jgi:putative inorganic carbon (hco3(-)) transporter
MRPIVRASAIGITVILTAAAFFGSGSKFGWLIAMLMGGVYLFRFPRSLKLKITVLVMVAILGIGAFAIRFHSYFEKGATSVVARLDYWHAAVQTTVSRPVLGTGPGTFQRPYAQLKSPNAEMARLAHNDYLEQFSDSGLPGGVFYTAWIFLALAFIAKNVWKSKNPMVFALFLGLLGWFIQGLGEFGLFIPGSAWTAFTLLGCILGMKEMEQTPVPPRESIRQKAVRS